MTTFQDAAASYFGLSDTGVRKTEVFTHEGEMLVVFEVPLTTEDVLGIADRMRTLQTDQAAPRAAIKAPVSREDMRAAYSALSPAERSSYGSFAKYVALGGGEDVYPVQPKIELPAHVYLSPAEVTEQQKVMAIGRDEKGNYAVAVGDLTAAQQVDHMDDAGPGGDALREAWCASVEQTTRAEMNGNRKPGDPVPVGLMGADEMRAGYVARTVEVMARLSGADGKPTSNADDFGGVPG